MKILNLAILLFSFISIQAQVGIGTTNPTSEFEIQTTNTGLPALELNPQIAPIGTATGQLSVIGDKLYLFDALRDKWLSVESMMLNFGLENGTDNQNLEYVGDILSSGPRMPYDGTIVYVTMNASGGQSDKLIQLLKNGVPIDNSTNLAIDGLIALDNYSYSNTAYNVDFSANDYFQVNVTSAGGAIENLSVLLWVKWRK